MTSSDPRVLEFFYFDAGGGHRSAATALRQVIADRLPHWRVEMVNLQELLQPVDPLFRWTKIQSQNLYNGVVKRGWTYGSLAMLRGLQKGIKAYAPQMEGILRQHWQNTRPDLVVSVIPNFNGVMFRALRYVHSDVPYVTVMTDLADCPPHFWQEQQDQYIVCGSDQAVEQAGAIGYRPEQIFQASGMILKPDFYRADGKNRAAERARLGLDPDLPTALIMFGGNGSKQSIKIVARMARLDFRLQSIVLCGHNKELQEKLQKRKSCHAVGFTDRVPDYMRLADFFIGKPGPGCISEALQCGLPVIVERNRRTMVQERYNTKWVEQRELGIVVKSFREIGKAVQSLFENGSLERFQRNARRLHNEAVFEIPGIFEQILLANAGSPRSADSVVKGVAAGAGR